MSWDATAVGFGSPRRALALVDRFATFGFWSHDWSTLP